jgi:hypothetical protein
MSYKNIPLFDDCDLEDFLVWRELLLSHLDTRHPQTAHLPRQNVSGELIGGNGEVHGGRRRRNWVSRGSGYASNTGLLLLLHQFLSHRHRMDRT